MPLPLSYPKFRAVTTDVDGNIIPLDGGKLYSYSPGTSTPKATYTDATLGTPNANPVILDVAGEADVWMDGAYKFILKDENDVVLWTVDAIIDPTKDTTFTGATLAGTLTITSTAITWSGNPTHSGNHTFSGNLVVNGNTTLGDAGADTLTVRPNAVTWTNNPTHSGNHTFNGTLTFNGAIVPTADYVGRHKFAVKSATTSRSSTTTLTDDPHLSLALTTGTWKFDILVPVWSPVSNAGGLKVTAAYSGTKTNDYWSIHIQATADVGPLTLLATAYSVSDALNINAFDAVNGANWVRLFGYLEATSSGNLTLQWAQSASNANVVKLGIGGTMSAVRVL